MLFRSWIRRSSTIALATPSAGVVARPSNDVPVLGAIGSSIDATNAHFGVNPIVEASLSLQTLVSAPTMPPQIEDVPSHVHENDGLGLPFYELGDRVYPLRVHLPTTTVASYSDMHRRGRRSRAREQVLLLGRT